MRTLRINRNIEQVKFRGLSLDQFRSIDQVAVMMQEPIHTIRLWIKEFRVDIMKTKRATGGKSYLLSPDNIFALQEIQRLLRVRKFTVAGAKQELADDPDQAERLNAMRVIQ